MWRRAATRLQTLALLKERALIQLSGGERCCNWLLSSSSSSVHSSAAPFNRTATLFAEHDADKLLKKEKTVEDVMPIATGLEREEIEAGLQVKQRFAIDPHCGPFGSKGISTLRQCLAAASSDIQPVSSPLSQIPALTSGETEEQSAAARKRKVQAVLKDIKQSPKKVNLVAALVRGMRVEDALLQMQVTVKRAAKTVYKVIHSARANAVHNHGLDGDRLIVAEAFVGKGLFLKRMWPHAKGRSGIRVRPRCRLTVVVRELTPEEEAEIAKLRVRKFRKLSKRESRLVPHKLVETQWQWHRKPKNQTVSHATT